jgi:intracellular multiplication protein IcmL
MSWGWLVSIRTERIKSSKGFYRDNYDRVCGLLLIFLIIIALLSAVLVFLYMHRPVPDFYATSMNGELSKLAPMDAPNNRSEPLVQ